MKKPIVIVIANQKGGAGKTTIAAAISQFLTTHSSVVLIDIDPQGTASRIFLEVFNATVFDGLTGTLSLDQAIVSALPQFPRWLKIIPSSPKLRDIDAMFAGRIDRFHCFEDAIAKIQGIDFIIVDCPGTLNLLTIAPLVAADYSILPVSCDPMCFDQIDSMKQTIEAIKLRLNPKLFTLPLVVTLFDGRNRLDTEVLAEIKARHETFEPIIRRRVKLKEEFAAQQPCTSKDLRELTNNIFERISHEQKKILSQRFT